MQSTRLHAYPATGQGVLVSDNVLNSVIVFIEDTDMPLTITLNTKTTIPIEVDSITLDAVRTLSADQVSQLMVYQGNRKEELGAFFKVNGSAEDELVIWQGPANMVKYIGAKLNTGTIRIEGSAGMHVGAEMTGGNIIVDGDVGDWLGAEMRGGSIEVNGNAGHLVGSVYRGGRLGMRGGVITVTGNVGNDIGQTMRRGTIIVGGKSGDSPGINMIAGTIILGGECGIRPGAGMKRGSIIYLNKESAPKLIPTFRYSSRIAPLYMQVYQRSLRSAGCSLADRLTPAVYDRHVGDLLTIGKGEILIPA